MAKRVLYLSWRGSFGNLPIKARLKTGEGEILGQAYLELCAQDTELPVADFHYTNWVHYDGIASYFKLEPFSEAYNKILWNFIDDAVAHQMDTLLVPLFTPALDTNVGGERLTTQLLDVNEKDGNFSFDFEKVFRFMEKAKLHGIRRFEISHLFTQWGAEHAPKIVTIDGRRIFGWETDSQSTKYLSFLNAMLGAFTSQLQKSGYDQNTVFFHLSDEPNQAQLERYLALKKSIEPSLGAYKTCDALSDVGFASDGAVDYPICALEHVKDFQERH